MNAVIELYEVEYSIDGKISKFDTYEQLMLFLAILSEENKKTILEVNKCQYDFITHKLLKSSNVYKKTEEQ